MPMECLSDEASCCDPTEGNLSGEAVANLTLFACWSPCFFVGFEPAETLECFERTDLLLALSAFDSSKLSVYWLSLTTSASSEP